MHADVAAQDAVELVLPVEGEQKSPPVRTQGKSPRQYQQRGFWQRLPPRVPWLRSWGLATAAAAWASTG